MRYPTPVLPETTVRKTDGFPERPLTPDIDAAAVREQTLRILEDPLFRNSKRYTDLLRFIVDRTLKGQMDDLHERIIGIEVFGRTPDYDTSADPTVRVTATEIRKRLALYYAGPEREHELRIEIPVRSYVAEFKPSKSVTAKPQTDSGENLQEPIPPLSMPVQSLSDVPPRKERKIWYLAASMVLAFILLVGWILHRRFAPPSALDTFWAPLTEDPGSILICIGISSRTSTVLAPTTAPDLQAPGVAAEDLPPQRGVVPMLDVSTALALGSLLRQKEKETVVVPANGTTLSDLRTGPAILVGSYENEWSLRLGNDLQYKFEKDPGLRFRWIQDKANPASHKWGFDIAVPQAQRDVDYALISRVLDPTTGHWWIGIGGLSGLGTYAAQQTITDPASFAKVAAQLPRDWSRKNIQIVLAVRAVHGSSGVPQVVASRSW